MEGQPRVLQRSPPRYEFPRLALVWFVVDLLLGRRRSFARDGQRAMAANPYPRRVEGLEFAPATGSFVLVMNHYNREGLRPYHCALAVSAALPARRPGQPEVRWAFTSELWGRRIGPVPIPLPLMRWVFRRFALVYSLVVLPRRKELVMGRAGALHHLLRQLGEAPVGLTPEAAGSGRLIEPPRGTGLFLAALGRTAIPFLPVGIWEEDDTLVIRFGSPFYLTLPDGLTRDEEDRLAAEQVMVGIGRLLPVEYHGAYAGAVELAASAPPEPAPGAT